MVTDSGRALVLAFNKWDLSTRTAGTTWTRRSTGNCTGLLEATLGRQLGAPPSGA